MELMLVAMKQFEIGLLHACSNVSPGSRSQISSLLMPSCSANSAYLNISGPPRKAICVRGLDLQRVISGPQGAVMTRGASPETVPDVGRVFC